jgi:hypothetical protein
MKRSMFKRGLWRIIEYICMTRRQDAGRNQNIQDSPSRQCVKTLGKDSKNQNYIHEGLWAD